MKCCMIANEKSILQTPKDQDVSSLSSPYNLKNPTYNQVSNKRPRIGQNVHIDAINPFAWLKPVRLFSGRAIKDYQLTIIIPMVFLYMNIWIRMDILFGWVEYLTRFRKLDIKKMIVANFGFNCLLNWMVS